MTQHLGANDESRRGRARTASDAPESQTLVHVFSYFAGFRSPRCYSEALGYARFHLKQRAKRTQAAKAQSVTPQSVVGQETGAAPPRRTRFSDLQKRTQSRAKAKASTLQRDRSGVVVGLPRSSDLSVADIALKMLEEEDENQNGVIDQSEFKAAGGTDIDFDRYDVNNDGALDVNELERMVSSNGAPRASEPAPPEVQQQKGKASQKHQHSADCLPECPHDMRDSVSYNPIDRLPGAKAYHPPAEVPRA